MNNNINKINIISYMNNNNICSIISIDIIIL